MCWLSGLACQGSSGCLPGEGGNSPISPNPPTQLFHGAPLWASHSLGRLPPSLLGPHIASHLPSAFPGQVSLKMRASVSMPVFSRASPMWTSISRKTWPSGSHCEQNWRWYTLPHSSDRREHWPWGPGREHSCVWGLLPFFSHSGNPSCPRLGLPSCRDVETILSTPLMKVAGSDNAGSLLYILHISFAYILHLPKHLNIL